MNFSMLSWKIKIVGSVVSIEYGWFVIANLLKKIPCKFTGTAIVLMFIT